MEKEITKKEVLKLLRKHSKYISMHPNSWRVLSFNKHRIVEDETEIFDIEVKFQHTNYISLIRDLYDTDMYGYISDGPFGIDDYSLITYLKIIILQLEKDGYIYINKQQCTYHTDFGMETGLDEKRFEVYEKYLDAAQFFSSGEKEYLETSILLTTKGQNKVDFFKDKIYSEPTGFVSLLISLLSLFISIFK